MDAKELLEDLQFLEELGLIEIDREGDVPRWWPTEKGKALGAPDVVLTADDVDVDPEGV